MHGQQNVKISIDVSVAKEYSRLGCGSVDRRQGVKSVRCASLQGVG